MRYFILFAVLVITGCINGFADQKAYAEDNPEKQRQTEASYKLDMIHAKCLGKAYGAGAHDITFVPKCERDPMLATLQDYHTPYMDVWKLKFDKKIALLEQLQHHKITKAQFDAQSSEQDASIQNMLNARLNADYQRNREYDQDGSAIVQGIKADSPINCISSTTYGVTNTVCH